MVLLTSVSTFSQKGLIGKISTGATFIKGNDTGFAGFFDLGSVLNEYISVSGSVGLITLKGAEIPVIPLGATISLLNFKSKTISPYIGIGAYYPFYNSDENFSSGSGVNIMQTNISHSGKFYAKFGGGISFRCGVKSRLVLTGYFNTLSISTSSNVTYRGGNNTQRITNKSNFASACVELFL